MAVWILYGTTRVSEYQKKHSSTHTYRGHQASVHIYCEMGLLSETTSSVLFLLMFRNVELVSENYMQSLTLSNALHLRWYVSEGCTKS